MKTWEEALAESRIEFNKWFKKEFADMIKEYGVKNVWLINFKENLCKAWQAGYTYRSLLSKPSKTWLELMALGY